MKKLLVISLLKGIAIATITHVVVSLMFGDPFWDRGMIVSVVMGLILGYFIFRNSKKYKGYKV